MKSIQWSRVTPKILHEFGQPMTARMILDTLQSMKLANNIPIGKLSSALCKQCTAGLMQRIVVKGLKGNFYALPEWFDSDGNMKKEHLPTGYNINETYKPHPIRQHHLIELEALYAESKITHSRMVEILNEIAAGGHKNGIEI